METEYEFTLPKGFVDRVGEVHKNGKMRLATAGDEMRAQRDPRVLANPSYLTIVLLSEVITELEGVETIAPSIVERTCIKGSMILSLQRCILYVRIVERNMIFL